MNAKTLFGVAALVLLILGARYVHKNWKYIVLMYKFLYGNDNNLPAISGKKEAQNVKYDLLQEYVQSMKQRKSTFKVTLAVHFETLVWYYHNINIYFLEATSQRDASHFEIFFAKFGCGKAKY